MCSIFLVPVFFKALRISSWVPSRNIYAHRRLQVRQGYSSGSLGNLLLPPTNYLVFPSIAQIRTLRSIGLTQGHALLTYLDSPKGSRVAGSTAMLYCTLLGMEVA